SEPGGFNHLAGIGLFSSGLLIALGMLLFTFISRLGAVGISPITLFLVTTTNDSNDGSCGDVCSLRDAIQQANNTPGGSSIIFSLPGSAPWTITLNSPLPVLNTYGGTQNMSLRSEEHTSELQ